MRNKPAVSKKSQSRGFSLIEVMLALGVGTVVVGVVSTTLAQVYRDFNSNSSDGAVLLSGTMIKQAIMQVQSTHSTSTCSSALLLDTSQNTHIPVAAGAIPSISSKVHLAISSGGQIFKKGPVLNAPNLQICQLYLDNFVFTGTNAGNATFLATLFISGGSLGASVCESKRPVELTNITVETSLASGAIVSCNAGAGAISPQVSCGDMSDMHWDANLNICTHVLVADNSNASFDKCPPGMRGTPPDACRAIPSTCKSGDVATSYKLGLVSDCVTPTNHVTLPVRAATPQAVMDLPPNPAAPPPVESAPTVVTYSPPAPNVQTTSQSAPAAPASCTDNTNVGAISIQSCINPNGLGAPGGIGIYFVNASCSWPPTPPSAGTSCVSRAPANYSTPDLTKIAPDPVAPNDKS